MTKALLGKVHRADKCIAHVTSNPGGVDATAALTRDEEMVLGHEDDLGRTWLRVLKGPRRPSGDRICSEGVLQPSS